jgi:hypothetical protein
VSDAIDDVIDAVKDAVDAAMDAVADAADAMADAAAAAADAVTNALTPTPAPEPVVALPPAPAPATEPVPAPAPAPAPTAPVTTESTSTAAAVAVTTGLRTPTVAKVFTVSTPQELISALSEARSLAGAEIRVNPGNYGDLVWTYKSYPLGRVYIVAATSTKPVFRTINVSASNNMSFHGLKMNGSGGKIVQLNSAENMSFTGSEITGLTDDRLPGDETATGIQVRFSKNVVVQDNYFSDLRAAIFIQRSTNVAIRYNRLHYIREGMNIAAATDLELRGNHFTHFYPRYDMSEHPDAIQFWTNNEVIGSVRVKIVENLISTGGMRAVQGLFAGSEVETARHADWEVTRNVYYGSSPHGLSFSRIDNAKVWNNVIAASPHADVNNSIRTATTSGGYTPQMRARFTANITAWNNIMMAGVVADSTSKVVQYDNWDIVDIRGYGQPWTDFFVGGRPDEEAPPLEAFLTRNPSAAYSKGAGITSPFIHGVRSLSKAQEISEVLIFLGK